MFDSRGGGAVSRVRVPGGAGGGRVVVGDGVAYGRVVVLAPGAVDPVLLAAYDEGVARGWVSPDDPADAAVSTPLDGVDVRRDFPGLFTDDTDTTDDTDITDITDDTDATAVGAGADPEPLVDVDLHPDADFGPAPAPDTAAGVGDEPAVPAAPVPAVLESAAGPDASGGVPGGAVAGDPVLGGPTAGDPALDEAVGFVVPQVLAPRVAGMAPGAELAALLDGVDITELGAFELVEATAAWQRLISWAHAQQAGALAELTRRREMRPRADTGYRSVNPVANTAMDIAGRTCTTTRQAENTIGHAVQLVDDFPATHAALATGVIDERRARVITTELGGQDPTIRRRVEAAVLPTAGEKDSVALRRKVKHLLHQLAPVETEQRCRDARQRRYVRDSPAGDGMAHLEAYMPAEDITAVMTTLNAAADTAKHRDRGTGHQTRTADQRRSDALAEFAWNSLTTGHLPPHPHGHPTNHDDNTTGHDGDNATGHDGDNATGHDGDGDGDGGSHAKARSSTDTRNTATTASTVHRGKDSDSDAGSGGTSDCDADRSGSGAGSGGSAAPADAGAASADGNAAPAGGDAAPVGTALARAHGRPVAVHVTIPLTTLLGLDQHPAHLDGYGPIPADTARHLAATGIWDWAGTHPTTGEILNYGRTRYRPPEALIDYIVLRDRECRSPGCHRPAMACDIDHRQPYNQGGPTSACNCLALCETHHLLKHHGGWRLERHPDGTYTWASPSGHHYTKPPEHIGPITEPPEPPEPPELPEPPEPPVPGDPPERPPPPGSDIPPF